VTSNPFHPGTPLTLDELAVTASALPSRGSLAHKENPGQRPTHLLPPWPLLGKKPPARWHPVPPQIMDRASPLHDLRLFPRGRLPISHRHRKNSFRVAVSPPRERCFPNASLAAGSRSSQAASWPHPKRPLCRSRKGGTADAAAKRRSAAAMPALPLRRLLQAPSPLS